MTATLTHPPAEDFGRFIEGTLDDAGRAAVVEHIADCDECRIIVVDSTSFGEESAAKPRVASGRWMAIAASLIVVVGAGVFVWDASRDPMTPAIEASAGLPSRPVDARLVGFAYAPKYTPRGEKETDLATIPLESAVLRIMDRHGNSAKNLHAVGVANLIHAALVEVDQQANEDVKKEASERIKSERAKALQDLAAAAAAAPDNARYQSDFAAALIAKGDQASLGLAVEACKKALSLDPNSQEALFNRAKALELMAQTPAQQHDAINAYNDYLKVDHSSPWADEARERASTLKELSKP